MQQPNAACTKAFNSDLAVVLPAFGCYVAASRSYTCAQDGLDTVQLALVVFFI